MELIQKCWTLERFTHEGRFFSINQPINVIPKPVQKPHPRIHVAGGSPDSYGLYAEKGWNLLGFSTLKPLTDVQRDISAFRQAWRNSPHPERRGEFSELAFVRCAKSEREADEPLVPYHRWLLQRFREFYSPNPKPGLPEPIPGLIYGEPAYADVKKNGMVVTGTPEQVIEQLRMFERYDVDRVMCQFRIGLMPNEMVMETMRMFCREVLPAFR
jgi:alkanesulfonate monooxygenase SsuD/methylene tetrahydromethanopterin reductase-like flavin-dependent oxidoreductase (luciferase family)